MPNHIRALAVTLPLAAILGGCLFEATIDAKGGAEVKLHYRVDPNAKLEKVAADLQSKDVKLVSKSMDKDHYIDATLQTADVTKLSTTGFFKAAAITLVDGPEKGTKTLTIHYLNKTPTAKIPPNALEYYGEQIKVGLTLPGEVVKSNATESKGSSATWTLETGKFFAAKENLFEVTYKLGK
jgi:hypothetical protein